MTFKVVFEENSPRGWQYVQERRIDGENHWQLVGQRSDGQTFYLNFPHATGSEEARTKLDTFLMEECTCVPGACCSYHVELLKGLETV